MQPASGDFTLSPATSRSSYEHRRLDPFTTRRLSAAIDALRHEGEAILWEMNSLKTQIYSFEQRIIGQTEELNMITRNLQTLREQHRTMEQQYQEKLQALRSELRAAQEGQPSTSVQLADSSASDCERHRSLSFPDSPQPFGNQHSHRNTIRQPFPLPPLTDKQVPASLANHREHTRYMVEDKDTAMYSAAHQHPPTSPPATLFQSPSKHSPYDTQRVSPYRNCNQSMTRPHERHDPQRNAASPTRLESSPSPTLVGSYSDGPNRFKTRKYDHEV